MTILYALVATHLKVKNLFCCLLMKQFIQTTKNKLKHKYHLRML